MNSPVRAQNLFSNVLSVGGGEMLARLTAFFGVTYLARVLGPEGFGLLGFATAVCSYLALTNLALNDIGTREVAKIPDQAGVVGVSVIVVKLTIAIAGWLILVLVFPLLGLPEEARPVLLFAGLLLFAMAMDGGWILKGLEQSRLIGVAQVLGQMLFVALVFLLVRTPDDIASAPLAQFGGEFAAALSEALVLAGVLWAVRRNGVQVKPGRLARPLLAAGIMAAVLLYAVPGLSLGLKLVLGCACYLASLLLLGGVPEDARPWLSRAPGAALTRKGKPIVRTRE